MLRELRAVLGWRRKSFLHLPDVCASILESKKRVNKLSRATTFQRKG